MEGRIYSQEKVLVPTTVSRNPDVEGGHEDAVAPFKVLRRGRSLLNHQCRTNYPRNPIRSQLRVGNDGDVFVVGPGDAATK